MEARRWIIVGVMAVPVVALCTRTFLAVYLLLPLGILGGWAALRALSLFVRSLDQKNAHDLREAARALARTAAWAALCAAVVWGHDVQGARLRAQAEQLALRLDEQRVGEAFPETAADVPLRCQYLRPQPTRYSLVCTLTPPFEKATFSSSTKRWE